MLIIATAIDQGVPLLTGNVKHYEVKKDLEVETFSP